jgi:hypothetical protein
LNPPIKLQNKNFGTDIKSDLTASNSQKNLILVLTWLEYDQELNTGVIEYFMLFPTVICAPRYDKRFRSYAILRLARLLKF